MKREREAVSTGERWGAIGDGSGGREKKIKNPENSRNNCGSEGIDKSVIEKRQSLRLDNH